jgi:4-amino-4-deoxy-L-arabinose transferase-like glycosyltransferase
LASLPLLGWTGTTESASFRYWGWVARPPYLIFGLLLGASLWYVARRLYGNAGGYIALALYCVSPTILRSSTLYSAQPEMGAAWGAFGATFTAIAVAHTLYAPREVVMWNWRRILLLGLSLALAIGSQFSLVILIPIALGFML